MRAVIWVINTDGKLYECTNSAESFLILADEYAKQIKCGVNDLILKHEKNYNPYYEKQFEVIHKSNNQEVTMHLINEINRLLSEKNELMKQRKALKKLKNQNAVEKLINGINDKLKNDYFEVNISNLLKNYHS